MTGQVSVSVEGRAAEWFNAIDGPLSAFGLSRAPEPQLLSLSENATYLVHAADTGQQRVLRVHRPGFRSREQIMSELAWCSALAESEVIATPSTVATADAAQMYRGTLGSGEELNAVLFEFASGRHPEDELADVFGRLGAITARLHAHAESWEPPAGFDRPVWTVESTIGVEGHWGHWSRTPQVGAAEAEVLAAVEQKIRAELGAYDRLPGRRGLIHGDLRVANLLEDGGSITVIDFDDCGFAWYLYDLACSLSFIEDSPNGDALCAAWLASYRELRSLDEWDLRAIPTLVMLRRLLLVAWMSTRAETEQARLMAESYVAGSVRIGRAYLEGTFLNALDRP